MKPPKVTSKDVTPASPPGRCFWCNEPVGHQHGAECVRWEKTVRVQFTFNMELKVPHHWDAEGVEFRYRESSYCMNNLVGELWKFRKELKGKGECLCPNFTEVKCLEEVDDE